MSEEESKLPQALEQGAEPKSTDVVNSAESLVNPDPVAEREESGAEATAKTADALQSHLDSVAEAQTIPEAEKAGKLHAFLAEKMKGVEDADETLKGSSIEDIRYNINLLSEKSEDPTKIKENLSTETLRRMKAYTQEQGDGWFVLDYAKFGADKLGLTHELHVGLGDILLDPSIQAVWVVRTLEDGTQESFKATRGVARGRVAFVDEYGEYVATYTGDKFRILTDTELEAEEYKAQLAKENSVREESQVGFRTNVVELAEAENPVTLKENFSVKEEIEDHNGKKMDVEITADTMDKAMAESSRGSNLDSVTKKPNIMKLINYVGYKVGIPNWMITTVLYHECSITWPAKISDKGKAVGMGQHHAGSWATAKKQPIFHSVMSNFIVENPGETGRSQNILADILASAVSLKLGADLFNINIDHKTSEDYLAEVVPSPDGYPMTRLAWIRMYYHVPSYARYYQMVMTKGLDNMSPHYQKGYKDAQVWMAKEKIVTHKKTGKVTKTVKWKGYDKYSKNAVKAHAAMERVG